MRALLDTGSDINAIHAEKARLSGFQIEPYCGSDIRDADGPAFTPIGQVRLQFHFKEIMSARTWEVPFVVLHDPPFDVAFGRIFISQARLIKRSPVMLPMELKKMTPGKFRGLQRASQANIPKLRRLLRKQGCCKRTKMLQKTKLTETKVMRPEIGVRRPRKEEVPPLPRNIKLYLSITGILTRTCSPVIMQHLEGIRSDVLAG